MEDKTQDFITPTKEDPIFVAQCDYIGRIERSLYKESRVDAGEYVSCMNTFSLSYTDGITALHEWIQENSWTVKEYPKCKFILAMVDGSLNKYEEVKEVTVYSISASKAKKLIIKE